MVGSTSSRGFSSGPCVRVVGTRVNPHTKATEPTEMPFGRQTSVDPWNCV